MDLICNSYTSWSIVSLTLIGVRNSVDFSLCAVVEDLAQKIPWVVPHVPFFLTLPNTDLSTVDGKFKKKASNLVL
ncbi:hypothetical protein DICVIV_11485 [Dictyocaulus viviparus]|uniref:Uncharacterized protein n=1 Tax=Dictyocaulus viviparus TaxID=29172 RepID=A0A0D8XD37_DICVI|nr:hypothetical protein DICVIV_11485 [Dictyocaulus viviparus]